METTILPVHGKNPQPRNIRIAADAIEKGEIVLIPTETGYCFVGDAKLESTRKSFLALREAHPNKKPFSILCKDIAQASSCALITTTIYRIATRAFPGPFTFILEINRNTPKFAGGPKRKSVGVRISSNQVTRDLINYFGRPLLITSVTDVEELEEQSYFEENNSNDHELPWWVDAYSICEHFKGMVPFALAAEESVPLKASTIIDFTQSPAVIIRDGGWDMSHIGFIEGEI